MSERGTESDSDRTERDNEPEVLHEWAEIKSSTRRELRRIAIVDGEKRVTKLPQKRGRPGDEWEVDAEDARWKSVWAEFREVDNADW